MSTDSEDEGSEAEIEPPSEGEDDEEGDQEEPEAEDEEEEEEDGKSLIRCIEGEVQLMKGFGLKQFHQTAIRRVVLALDRVQRERVKQKR